MIQTLLFTAGLNTLLQTALGSRLPTVMRSSFVFILPVLSIINDFSDKNFSSEHEVCGFWLFFEWQCFTLFLQVVFAFSTVMSLVF